MKQDTKIAALTQAKISQYVDKVCTKTSRPEKKFVHDMMYGLLKTGMPQLGSIGRSLNESISVKKRTERLRHHLQKSGLGMKLMEGHIEAQKKKINRCDYLLVDSTDISKKYATKLEGQAGVYDGSEQKTGYGYPVVTIVGVCKDRSDVVPVYLELYSLKRESTSENIKILNAIETVTPNIRKTSAFVMDRGMDRSRIFARLLEGEIPFIIRMNNKRYLWTEEGRKKIWEIAKYTKLPYQMKQLRRGKNRTIERLIICGVKRVRLTPKGPYLWLVSAKYKGNKGGRFYFLTNLRCETESELVMKVVNGYHLRWVIEEVHREIKKDLNLESIRLFGYDSIKTMSVLTWISAGFYYTKLAGLEHMDILLDMARSVIYRLKLKEITGFIFYKLFYLVHSVLKSTKRIRRTAFKLQYNSQLMLFEKNGG